MFDFKPEPSRHLVTESDLRGALADPSWMDLPYPGKWSVKSDTIIGVIDEMVNYGAYPYNQDVQREVERRLAISRQPVDGSPLSTLVYNAQGYWRSDRLVARGFVPLTEDLLREVGPGARVELVDGTILHVREVAGTLCVMKPRARRYQVLVHGQACRVLAKTVSPQVRVTQASRPRR